MLPIVEKEAKKVRAERLGSLAHKVSQNRLQHLRQVFARYCDSDDLANREDQLRLEDVCFMQDFRLLLEQPIEDADEDVITETSFDQAIAGLAGAKHVWQQQRLSYLRGLLDSGFNNLLPDVNQVFPHQTDIMAYADRPGCLFSIYRCNASGCRGTNHLSQKEALNHRCYLWPSNFEQFAPAVRAVLGSSHRLPWNHENCIVLDEVSFQCITTILNLCNLNLNTTYEEDLDTLDARFVCSDRHGRPDGHEVYNWRQMVGFHTKAKFFMTNEVICISQVIHAKDTTHRPIILNDAQEQEAKTLELARPLSRCHSIHPSSDWTCNLCEEPSLKKETLYVVEHHISSR
jgi:hypothetical protein